MNKKQFQWLFILLFLVTLCVGILAYVKQWRIFSHELDEDFDNMEFPDEDSAPTERTYSEIPVE